MGVLSVSYHLKCFSNWQTQIHSRDYWMATWPTVTSFFPELVRHRMGSQLKDRKYPAYPQPEEIQADSSAYAAVSGVTTSLDFRFNLTCTTASLNMSL